MFNLFNNRTSRLKSILRQLGIQFEEDNEGLIYLRYHTAGRPNLICLSDFEGTLFVYSQSNSRYSPLNAPHGLAEFLSNRNRNLSDVVWQVKVSEGHVKARLFGQCDFEDINSLSLARLCATVAEEVATVDSILVQKGVFHG